MDPVIQLVASDQQKSVPGPVQSPSLPETGPMQLESSAHLQFSPVVLLPSAQCSVPTHQDKWADRWAASAVTSRFVGPIGAPGSFFLRGFPPFLPRGPIGGRPGPGDGPTFEKNSMAPNSRSPYLFLGCRPVSATGSANSASPVAHHASRTEKITDETSGPPARFPSSGSSSAHSVLPPMHGSYFCGSSKILTSSADWIFQNCVSSPQVSQSISHSPVSQWVSGQGRPRGLLSWSLSFFTPGPQV